MKTICTETDWKHIDELFRFDEAPYRTRHHQDWRTNGSRRLHLGKVNNAAFLSAAFKHWTSRVSAVLADK